MLLDCKEFIDKHSGIVRDVVQLIAVAVIYVHILDSLQEDLTTFANLLPAFRSKVYDSLVVVYFSYPDNWVDPLDLLADYHCYGAFVFLAGNGDERKRYLQDIVGTYHLYVVLPLKNQPKDLFPT